MRCLCSSSFFSVRVINTCSALRALRSLRPVVGLAPRCRAGRLRQLHPRPLIFQAVGHGAPPRVGLDGRGPVVSRHRVHPQYGRQHAPACAEGVAVALLRRTSGTVVIQSQTAPANGKVVSTVGAGAIAVASATFPTTAAVHQTVCATVAVTTRPHDGSTWRHGGRQRRR